MEDEDQEIQGKLERISELLQRGRKHLHAPTEALRAEVERAVRERFRGVKAKKESFKGREEGITEAEREQKSQTESPLETERKTKRHGHTH